MDALAPDDAGEIADDGKTGDHGEFFRLGANGQRQGNLWLPEMRCIMRGEARELSPARDRDNHVAAMRTHLAESKGAGCA